MQGREYASLEAAVDHAVECGREAEALEILWQQQRRAAADGDAARMSAVLYLAQCLYSRDGWGHSREAARLIRAATWQRANEPAAETP